MATTEVSLHAVNTLEAARPVWSSGVLISAALTLPAIAIHGYHPYAEDGGVYLAGVKRTLDPALYPHFSGFVTAHLKFSLFAPMVAGIVRVTHLGLMPVMFLLYAATIWLTLYAGWLLAERLTLSEIERAGAVSLLALTLTIPVAGTSLILVDPYVTARSLSTPCGLLMLVATLDLRAAWTAAQTIDVSKLAMFAAVFAIAAMMHPLMATYSLGCALLVLCCCAPGRKAAIASACAVCAIAVIAAALLEYTAPCGSAEYATVVQSRTYWFLSNWQWYELLGLVGPLVVIACVWLQPKANANSAAKSVAWMSIAAGASAGLVAALFAHVSSHSYGVARLQPLRAYQTIYAILMLSLGATLARHVLARSAARWALMVVLVGGAMAWVQRQTFPHSAHLELPSNEPENPWTQAFAWARMNTPRDAVFALDARYTSALGEDSQNFRAVAERSVMPDYAKDGGVASIAPRLTAEWTAGENAQKDLDRGVSPAEIARLRSYGVDWVVIERDTPTTLTCAFENSAVKVCPLR